jgi:hypothetical protein
VCQHDDGPKHVLPPKTLVFSLSRSRPNPYIKQYEVIPAVCSPVPNLPNTEKDIFASFVGSVTHPIRNDVYNACKDIPGYYFSGKGWHPVVSSYELNHFLEITKRSKYVLCPRGYGNTSFRMYETMQLGAVPVYISDDFFTPWNDELDWNEFCVLIPSDKIYDIDKILKSISDEQYQKMINRIQEIYPKYFTLEATYNNIIRKLK